MIPPGSPSFLLMHNGIFQAFVVVLLVLRPVAAAAKSNWFDQSWFFEWTPPGAPFPVPTTAQCETLHITWSRQTATGPDPVSPYFLQIYTSNFQFPFVVPAGSNPETYFAVPFAPGTEYEICMIDSGNSTGGCQAVYTVYPNTTTSTPTCANLTMPEKTLDVRSEAPQGTLSPYGWVPSCSDIRVTPRTGTPPFTFTVSPALHPPLNITSNDKSSINWTVNLSWGLPFFISMTDSTGLTWSNGPIHAGKGSTSCFSDVLYRQSVPLTVGIGIGGLVVGAMATLVVAFLYSKRRKARRFEGDEKPVPFFKPYSLEAQQEHELRPGQYTATTSASSPRYERLPSLTGASHEFHVEPFVPPTRPPHARPHSSDDVSGQAARRSWNGNENDNPLSPSPPGRYGSPANQVYVIHHDSGGAPVSVVTPRGAQVVELPPGYSPSLSPAPRVSPTQRRQGKSTGTARDSRGTASS